MSASDRPPGPTDPRTQALLDAIVDSLDGSADETREYRPVRAGQLEGSANEEGESGPGAAALVAKRLAMRQQLREVAKLAEVARMSAPVEQFPAVAAAPARATAHAPTAALKPAAARPVAPPPDRTVQLAPITTAFADAIMTPAPSAGARVRWALVCTLTVALPAGLLLYPSPAAKPQTAHGAEPAVPAAPPESGAAAATELPAPSASPSAGQTDRRPTRKSMPASSVTDRENGPSRPDPPGTRR
jgi:hypothetical protein